MKKQIKSIIGENERNYKYSISCIRFSFIELMFLSLVARTIAG